MVGLVLAGCGGPPTAADLEAVAFQTGDLPTAITKDEVFQAAPGVYDSLAVPKAKQAMALDFKARGEDIGNTIITIHESTVDRNDAYDRIVGEFIPTAAPVEGLGETSAALGGRVAFTRCNALVRIILLESIGSIAAYAKRIDRRLQETVC